MHFAFFREGRGEQRATLQAFILIGLGLLCLLGALIWHPDPFVVPVGLLCFGSGMLLSAIFNPARLVIAGVLYTLVGAAIFIAFRPLIPYDNGLVVIAIGLALLVLALLARRGYVGLGAVTPGLLILLVGFFLYPPTGRGPTKLLAPFILSLWFPGILLLLLGLVYWFGSTWRARRTHV